jgi:hypothetical protein
MKAAHAGRWIVLAVALTAVLLRPTAATGQAMTGAAPMRAETSTAKPSPAVPPEKSRPVVVTRFEKAPVVDGKLDEEVWKTAAVLKDFYQINPGDNVAPSYPTETLLGYDSRTLYIGFRCADDPTKVRATLAKRDAVPGTEDTVRILLDTFNDKRRAYILVFNPLGVQQDGVRTEGSGDDFSVDVVMESKGVITADGYTVEVAVPLKSLRYTAGKGRLWGVHVFRTIQRLDGEQDSWMPLSRSDVSTLGQAGQITGLENLSTERTLELIPSLTASETGRRVKSIPPGVLRATPGLVDQGRFVNGPAELDPGLTVRFGITPTVTLDFAANPDFAQVEADQLVVTTNQRFPIFYAEKRPFFLEGVEIFQTPLTALHTRAVVDPDYAAKLTGKVGRDSFGLLVASDNGPGDFIGDDRLNPKNYHYRDRNALVAVLRYKRDVGRDSNVGLLATSYDFNGREEPPTDFDLKTNDPCKAQKSLERGNRLVGIDGHFRVNKITNFDFQVAATTSRRCFFDPEAGRGIYRRGRGLAYTAVYDVTGRNFGWVLGAEGRTRDYRADLGFTPRTGNNYDWFGFRYSTDPKRKGWLVNWKVTSSGSVDYDFRGRLQFWVADVTAYWFLRRNTNFRLAYRRGGERLYEEEFGTLRGPGRSGAFFGPAERSANRNDFIVFFSMKPGKKYGGQFRAAYRMGTFDLDSGGGPGFPRVSPAALADPDARLDPGAGDLLDVSGNAYFQPTDALRVTLDYLKNRLVRDDTRLVAFDDDIYSVRATYQFTRFVAARVRVDYTSLQSRARAQFLFAWTPNPGTAFYAGYNDDVNRNGYSPTSGLYEPGLRRNGRTFFVKMSYLFRKSF